MIYNQTDIIKLIDIEIYIYKKPCVLPKQSLLTHPLGLPLRLQESLLLLAGTDTIGLAMLLSYLLFPSSLP